MTISRGDADTLLNHTCFQQIVRFYLVLDAKLQIVSLSPAMLKLLPSTLPGQVLAEVLHLRRNIMPLRPETVEGLVGLSTVFESVTRSDVTLMGAIYQLDDIAQPWLLVAYPRVESLAALADLGLELQDFSASDSMATLLMALSVKASALAELQSVKQRLQHSEITETADTEIEQRSDTQTVINVNAEPNACSLDAPSDYPPHFTSSLYEALRQITQINAQLQAGRETGLLPARFASQVSALEQACSQLKPWLKSDSNT